MKILKKLTSLFFCLCMTVMTLQIPIFGQEEETTKPASKPYTIYPTPHSITYGNSSVTLDDVNIVISDKADVPTKENLEEILNKNNISYSYHTELSDTKTNIVLGIKGENPDIQHYFDDLQLEDVSALNKLEGYVLSVKNDDIYIMGSESVALYYGILTLKQMITTSVTIADVLINDYSDNINRGTVEGFYGIPWSVDTRADIIQMMGEYKMNEYIYAPKDDPYHFGEHWYELYPNKELSEMKGLVDVAKNNNVDFIYTLHVSNYMDLSDTDDAVNKNLPEKTSQQWDLDGTDGDRGTWVPEGQHAIDNYDANKTFNQFVAKFDQMYNIGVRRFGILADDINFPVARYSIPYLVDFMNTLQEYLMTHYEGIEPLLFCPSYYYQQDANYNGKTYMKYIKDGFDQKITTGLDSKIEVMWTGKAVMSNVNYTNSEYLEKWIDREPLIWWNYPVTDYIPSYVLLGPNPGLEKNATNMTGVISNPMQQGLASEISLFGVANYAWNTSDYDTHKTWQDSFGYLFPEVADSLYLIAQHATVGNNTTALDKNEESVYLQPYLKAFKEAVETKDTAAITTSGTALSTEFDRLLNAIEDVRNNCQSKGLLADLKPWLDKLESLCRIGKAIIEVYTGSEPIAIWDAYSMINSETNRWPFITVDQLEGGKVAAEIGTEHLTPFIKEMAIKVEESLNDTLLVGDKLTNKNQMITNIPNLKELEITKNENTFSISNIENITLEPYHYIGFKLENTYLADTISVNLNSESMDSLSIQYSMNGIEWITLTGEETKNSFIASLNGEAIRYIRVNNTTNEKVVTTITNLQTTIKAPAPMKVKEASANASLHQGNGPKNLVDGNYDSSYWTNSNQVAGQEVVLEYEKVFNLYDFALYESTSDYIRKGGIYVSENGQDWTKVSDVGANFKSETVDGNGYYVIRGHGNGVATKYVKIKTESTANNWTRIHEWEINQTVAKETGVLYPFNDVKDGKPLYSIDTNIKTAYTTTSDEGFLQYTMSEYTTASQLVVLQNSQNISNAKVNIRTTDGWHEIGTLAQSFNTFDISSYRDILEVKLEWTNTKIVPQINELYTITNTVDKSALITAIEKANIYVGNTTNKVHNQTAKNTLLEVVLQAQGLLSDSYASRGQVSDSIRKIDTAILNLKKEELQTLVEECLTLQSDNYTEITWQPFKACLDKAQQLLHNENATIAEIEAMITELSNAKETLKKVIDESHPIKPTNPNVNTGDSTPFYELLIITITLGVCGLVLHRCRRNKISNN